MKKGSGFTRGAVFLNGIWDRKLMLYASAGTYHIFMAIIPVIMLAVSLVQYLPITQEYVVGELSALLPAQVMEVVARVLENIVKNGRTAMTVSIVLTVFSASAAARSVMRGLDAAYSAGEQNIVLYYLRSMVHMVLLVVMLLMSFVIMAYGGKIMDLIQKLIPQAITLLPLFPVLRYARYGVVIVLLFLVLLLMYYLIPVRRLRLRDQWPGALFASLSLALFSLAFSWYLSWSDRFGAYGVIGTVMAAMMWLYYSIFFILIGGWLNSFLQMTG